MIVGLTVSLDGHCEDAIGSAGALRTDREDRRESSYRKGSRAGTGALLRGRRTFDTAGDPDSFAVDDECQVPLSVPTRRPPGREPHGDDRLSVTCVTEGLQAAGPGPPLPQGNWR